MQIVVRVQVGSDRLLFRKFLRAAEMEAVGGVVFGGFVIGFHVLRIAVVGARVIGVGAALPVGVRLRCKVVVDDKGRHGVGAGVAGVAEV